jgi:hypothetical protein
MPDFIQLRDNTDEPREWKLIYKEKFWKKNSTL